MKVKGGFPPYSPPPLGARPIHFHGPPGHKGVTGPSLGPSRRGQEWSYGVGMAREDLMGRRGSSSGGVGVREGAGG